MISIKSLTNADKGKRVIYRPYHSANPVFGIIKKWDDLYIWVLYDGDNNSKATRAYDLIFDTTPIVKKRRKK